MIINQSILTKEKLTDLAIFGGKPISDEVLHVGRPNVADRHKFLKRIEDILDRRWFTNDGPCVMEFERKIEEYVGVRNCVATCNATVALEIAARALGLSGEVIVPSFTFIATAHSLQWQEITPVFCDIDPETHNLDPAQVERLITPRTTGILGVHLWGRACDIDALANIARRRGLKLFFDAAHAFGCSYKGRKIGGFGDAEVLSFHATKFFNTLEGGALLTNDDDLAEKVRLMRNFGFSGLDNVIYIGTNGKMNEISASMGLTLFESIDEVIEINRQNYYTYCEELASLAGVHILQYDERERNNFHYIVLEIDLEETHISRDYLIEILYAENIRARRYFYPGCHRMEPYRSYFPNAGLLLPETEKLSERVLVLPTGTILSEMEIRRICEIIRFSVTHGSEIVANWSLRNTESARRLLELNYVNNGASNQELAFLPLQEEV